MSGTWRYILQTITGSGTPGAILHPDLPLVNVSITEGLNATDELTGAITPADPVIKDMLTKWGTVIWAENSGQIRGGGIVVHTEEQGPALTVECMGFHGYAYGMPYTSMTSYNGVEVDPLDVYRVIWNYIQTQPGGNIGLAMPSTKTGLKIGVELSQGQFDTENGPISFESGPYMLNFWDTHDLGKAIDDLAADTPFDFREKKAWNAAGTSVDVRMEVAYPRFSRRRTDLRFVIGENVILSPTVTESGDDYANEILLLGAGEGRTMVRGQATLPRANRLRRVVVEEDKGIKSVTTANVRALNLLRAKIELGDITDFTVLDHPNAPLGSVQAGDEIQIHLDYDWQEGTSFWVRIEKITYSPDEGNNYQLSVVRADKVA